MLHHKTFSQDYIYLVTVVFLNTFTHKQPNPELYLCVHVPTIIRSLSEYRTKSFVFRTYFIMSDVLKPVFD